MNRGSATRAGAGARPRRRFNEAPIHESGKSAATPRSGAWPRRFNEAPIHESGKFQQRSIKHEPTPASMRPRFMNRGSAQAKGLCFGHYQASMRPRFMNRGSLALQLRLDLLQPLLQ